MDRLERADLLAGSASPLGPRSRTQQVLTRSLTSETHVATAGRSPDWPRVAARSALRGRLISYPVVTSIPAPRYKTELDRPRIHLSSLATKHAQQDIRNPRCNRSNRFRDHQSSLTNLKPFKHLCSFPLPSRIPIPGYQIRTKRDPLRWESG